MATIIRGFTTCFDSLRRSVFGWGWPETGPQGWVRTDYLVEQPSLISGAARVVDLFGQYDGYNISLTPRQADAIALYSDWRVIGQDLWRTMDNARQSISVVKEQQAQ